LGSGGGGGEASVLLTTGPVSSSYIQSWNVFKTAMNAAIMITLPFAGVYIVCISNSSIPILRWKHVHKNITWQYPG